jgi:hypothetical protein
MTANNSNPPSLFLLHVEDNSEIMASSLLLLCIKDNSEIMDPSLYLLCVKDNSEIMAPSSLLLIDVKDVSAIMANKTCQFHASADCFVHSMGTFCPKHYTNPEEICCCIAF